MNDHFIHVITVPFRRKNMFCQITAEQQLYLYYTSFYEKIHYHFIIFLCIIKYNPRKENHFMIVKKMPILKGFSGLESVKFLSKKIVSENNFRPVFYDIETTGLSQYSSFLYLIGAVVREGSQWMLHQWMIEKESEEKELLCIFSDFIKNYTLSIQYNGDHFDQPYLEARCSVYGLPSPFSSIPSLDLYQTLKPCKALLKLPGMKQPQLEAFLGLPRRLFCDGREGIRCFRSYLKTPCEETAQELLGHNAEDLTGLLDITQLLSCLCLWDGRYRCVQASREDDAVLFLLKPMEPFPVLFSNGNGHLYLSGRQNELRVLVPLNQGRLQQFYENYRDYDYLPGEDTAILKSLSSCIDRKLRKPATRDTCYTWFSCDEQFLSDPGRQMQYLTHALPHFLHTLK